MKETRRQGDKETTEDKREKGQVGAGPISECVRVEEVEAKTDTKVSVCVCACVCTCVR